VDDSGDVKLTCSNSATDAKLTFYAAPTSTWSTEISINGADTPTEGCVAVRTAVDATRASSEFAESGSTGYDYVKFCGNPTGGATSSDHIDLITTKASYTTTKTTHDNLITDIGQAETDYGTTLAANYAGNETAIAAIEDDETAMTATASSAGLTFTFIDRTAVSSGTYGSCSDPDTLTWTGSIWKCV
jgi:hypothetical protein